MQRMRQERPLKQKQIQVIHGDGLVIYVTGTLPADGLVIDL